MTGYHSLPFPFVFLACFPIPSVSFRFWCVLVFDIITNGCISSSRCLRAFLQISSVCSCGSLCYITPPLSSLFGGAYGYIGIIPPPPGLCMYVVLSQEALPSSRGLGIAHCCRSRYVVSRYLSRCSNHSFPPLIPQSSLTVTIFYCLVRCSRTSRNQCTFTRP